MSANGFTEMKWVRNIGIMAHIDAGKTTTTERILYYTGRTHRMGEVHDGDTEMDWMPEERRRGITITSAATSLFWHEYQINLIDTPGHVDFTAEVERSLRILDGGIVIFSGVEMVESQSETVWHQADRYRIPRIAFINKLDRVESNYIGTLEMLEERLGARVIPLQLPYCDSDRCLVGMIDLLEQRLIVWNQENKGETWEYLAVPEKLRASVEHYREMAIERVAEFSDRVMECYVEGKNIDLTAFHNGLRRGCIRQLLVPVLGGSAIQNQGIQPLLDAVTRYLPSPLDVPPVHELKGDTVRLADIAAPFAALAFKVVLDRYVGRLVFIRVYSGKIRAGAQVLNVSTGKSLRLSRIFRMHANQRTQLDEARAGEIVAVVGSKDISTGDTLSDRAAPILLEAISFPEPVVFVAIEPRSESERGALHEGLARLAQEDPTFRVAVDETTNQTIISGMGELHLEILMERLRNEEGISAAMGKPQVAYRETLREPISVDKEFAKQTTGRGQYAHVIVYLEPLSRGSGVQFVDAVNKDEIPKQYRAAAIGAMRELLTNGPLAGYPLVDIKVTLAGGSFNPVDSSEVAFRAAATDAFHDVFERGTFDLLEPIMEGEVATPGEYLGEVMDDLGQRRGVIQSCQPRGGVQVIVVCVPLAQTFGYATRLRSLTQGRAAYTLRVTRYDVVPEELSQMIMRNRGY
ncbi:MAG: elongation factor G [Candidatus Bipolaricaulota bacterium]